MPKSVLGPRILEALGQTAANVFVNTLMDKMTPRTPVISPRTPRTKQRQKARNEAKQSRKFAGRLGGKVKRGKKVRVFSRRKYGRTDKYQKYLSKLQSSGILQTSEDGISPSTSGGSNSVYIGHCTFAKDFWLQGLMRLLVKKLALKAQSSIGDFTDAANNLFVTGDVVQLEYRERADTGFSNITHSYVSPQTWDNIASGLFNAAVALYGRDDIVFTNISINRGTPSIVSIPLSNCSVTYYAKSSLKIQNATVSTAGAEADEVDNVPISGKSYTAYGSGLMSKLGISGVFREPMVCNNTTGSFVGTGSSVILPNMPPAGYFRNVTHMASERIDPGKIKYSNLYQSKTISLMALTKQLFSAGPQGAGDWNNFGVSRIFGFEHVIKAKSTAPTITILGEHNLRLGMNMNFKLNTVTNERFAQLYTIY